MNNVTVLQPEKPHDLNVSQLALIKRTVAKDCNNDEFDMFMSVCRRVGLDPFRRQIHCVIYNKNKADKRQMVLITAIDGLRAVAARAENYRPDENPPEIIFDKEAKDPLTNPRGIVRAVVRPWKLGADGKWYQISGEAYWEEFAPLIEEFDYVDTGGHWPDGNPKQEKVPTGKFKLDVKNSFWRKMPNLMLAKCAEAQALRRGWPEDLSGIYSSEEVARTQAQNASEELEEFERTERIKKIGGSDNIMIQWYAGDALEPVSVGEFADKALEFISKCASGIEIESWKNLNRHSLQQFWALHPGDALELKKSIEGKILELG